MIISSPVLEISSSRDSNMGFSCINLRNFFPFLLLYFPGFFSLTLPRYIFPRARLFPDAKHGSTKSKIIWCIIEDQTFSPPPPLLLPLSRQQVVPVCHQSSLPTEGGGVGRGKEPIIRRRESLVLYYPLTSLNYQLAGKIEVRISNLWHVPILTILAPALKKKKSNFPHM
jgi:hypothetical protein